jgi:hypothetical protein
MNMGRDRSSPAAEEVPQVEATEEEVQEVHEPDALELAIARGVESWYAAHVRDSAIARDTPAYNHLHSVVPELSKHIRKELEQ